MPHRSLWSVVIRNALLLRIIMTVMTTATTISTFLNFLYTNSMISTSTWQDVSNF